MEDESSLSFREFVMYLPLSLLFYGILFNIFNALAGGTGSIKECFEFGAVIGLFLWLSAFFLDPDDTILDDVGL